MKFFIPKPGDTVRVRLHDGRAVDAVYMRHEGRKSHSLTVDGEFYIAASYATKENRGWLWTAAWECRFIGPTPDMIPRAITAPRDTPLMTAPRQLT